MPTRFLLFLIVFFTSISSFGIRVIFDYRVFHLPGEGPYVEFVTSFDARTLSLNPADSGLFQSHAELTIIVMKAAKIVDFRKVAVDGPMVEKGFPSDFMSLERFMLAPGIYDLEVEVRDLGTIDADPVMHTQKIEINLPSNGPFISDIQFVSAYRPSNETSHFTKSGYDILPYASDYFPSSLNGLIFYAELYGTDDLFGEGVAFVSNVCIIDAQDNSIENCKKIKREKGAKVVPMLQTIDISDLTTGEYKVRVEIRDRANQVVSVKERNFSRNKIIEMDPVALPVTDQMLAMSFVSQFTDRDELYKHILYHIPIANDLDQNTIDNQLEESDLTQLQSFLFTFWSKRNRENPGEEWMKYNENIKVVKQNFETRIKPGWQTERGRVYLQYGKPNTRVVRPSDPDYWPFEIWHYYVTDSNLHNRRFLFYDTNLSGDHELLHSDVPGETKNFNWKQMARSRPAAYNASDASMLNAASRKDPNSRDEIEDLWFNPH